METINVKDLPESVARAVAAMVDALRNQLPSRTQRPKGRVELPVWPGTVHGTLSRKELYEDVA